MLTHSFMITVALRGRRVENEKPSRLSQCEVSPAEERWQSGLARPGFTG